jgi:hypothetical protein
MSASNACSLDQSPVELTRQRHRGRCQIGADLLAEALHLAHGHFRVTAGDRIELGEPAEDGRAEVLLEERRIDDAAPTGHEAARVMIAAVNARLVEERAARQQAIALLEHDDSRDAARALQVHGDVRAVEPATHDDREGHSPRLISTVSRGSASCCVSMPCVSTLSRFRRVRTALVNSSITK